MRIGTISYNIYCNFTNYGSALQTWALHRAIEKTGQRPVLVDYCPDVLSDKDPLNPFGNMWDQDEESKRMVELTMPAIRKNYAKFNRFYHEQFVRTNQKYTSSNFHELPKNESLDGYVCGSDTIFCPDEFGFDDGYYANYPCMKKKSVAYAASFGDPHFTEAEYRILDSRIQNFCALGIREEQMIPYLKQRVNCPIDRVLDPTLLLKAEDYSAITAPLQDKEKYLLLYSRRYSKEMEEYASKLAKNNGWKIIEISLRAVNSEKGHRMFYDAGVEEFLSLVNHAEYIVTNSFHGMIFSVQFRKQFVVFSREQCDNKIAELLSLFGIHQRIMVNGNERVGNIDYGEVHGRIEKERKKSLQFLNNELSILERVGKSNG